VEKNANLPLVFSSSSAVIAIGEARTGEGGQPVRTFKKEIVQAGQWRHPADGQLIDIPQARLSHWKTQFDRMEANGMKVYAPSDHTRQPDANRGWVTAMEVVDDKLVATMDLIGEDAIKLASRIDVSIQARDLKDGKGNKYPDAIEHVALVADPVITGLEPFVIQLSRAKTLGLSIGGSAMESLKKIAAAMGIEAGEMDENDLTAAIMAHWGKSKGESDKISMSLNSVQSENATLKLSAKPVEVDPDVLESAARGVEAELSMLVMSRQITPAQKKLWSDLLCGTEAKRPALMLSRKAAQAAGFTAPQSKPILDILKQAPKPDGSGETLSLSREGGTDSDELSKEEVEKINADVKAQLGR